MSLLSLRQQSAPAGGKLIAAAQTRVEFEVAPVEAQGAPRPTGGTVADMKAWADATDDAEVKAGADAMAGVGNGAGRAVKADVSADVKATRNGGDEAVSEPDDAALGDVAVRGSGLHTPAKADAAAKPRAEVDAEAGLTADAAAGPGGNAQANPEADAESATPNSDPFAGTLLADAIPDRRSRRLLAAFGPGPYRNGCWQRPLPAKPGKPPA